MALFSMVPRLWIVIKEAPNYQSISITTPQVWTSTPSPNCLPLCRSEFNIQQEGFSVESQLLTFQQVWGKEGPQINKFE